MKKKEKLHVAADCTLPIFSDDIKVVFNEQDINTNWLLNQILNTKNQQITKISNEELMRFLGVLRMSNLKMPDGSDSLVWLKKRLKKRFDESQSQRGSTWEEVSGRYKFIVEQIDLLLSIEVPTAQ